MTTPTLRRPCPEPGFPGATIERGPRKGQCNRQAEFIVGARWCWWLCKAHGIVTPQVTTVATAKTGPDPSPPPSSTFQKTHTGAKLWKW